MAYWKGRDEIANKAQECFEAGRRWARSLPAPVLLNLRCDIEDGEAIDWRGDYKMDREPDGAFIRGVYDAISF